MNQDTRNPLDGKRAQVIWLVFLISTLLNSLCFVLWINLAKTSTEFARILLPSLIAFSYLLQISGFLASCVYRRCANSNALLQHLKQARVSIFYYVLSSVFWLYFIVAVVGFAKVRGAFYPISGLDTSLGILFAFYALTQLLLFIMSVFGLISSYADGSNQKK